MGVGPTYPRHSLARAILTRSRDRYFGSIIPGAFTVFSMQGFLILNCIIGGQTLASVSSHLDDTLGIIIIGVLSLIVRLKRRGYLIASGLSDLNLNLNLFQVTFFGYRVIHW